MTNYKMITSNDGLQKASQQVFLKSYISIIQEGNIYWDKLQYFSTLYLTQYLPPNLNNLTCHRK